MKHLKTIAPLTLTLGLAFAMAACGDDSSGGSGGMGGMATGTGGTSGGSGGASGGSGGGTGSGATGGSGGGAGGEACSTLDIATEAGLTSLVAAVEAAGLTEAVEGENLTIFAPTNEAFADLLEALGKDGLGDLQDYQLVPILTYHVAGSVIDSTAALSVAAGAGEFDTLGGNVKIAGDATDGLFLDADESNAEINLELIDVEACNGTIVHVIDTVILPSIADIVTTQDRFSGLTTLIGASDTDPTDVGAALDGASADGAWTLFAPDNTAAAAAATLGLTAEQVTDVLLYHAYSSAEAVDSATAVTLDATIEMANGDDLEVLGAADPVSVTLTDEEGNEVAVDLGSVDIYAYNGIIHGIPAVLIPSALVP